MDPTRHNYYRKLMELQRRGRIPAASLAEVDICHDDWCGVYEGNYCDCDPDVRLRPLSGGGKAGVRGSADEDTHPLRPPTTPCPHCGSKEFIVWQAPHDPTKRAISCNGCGSVISSTHPLDPDDRPVRRP
jgi:hypothetical protein